MTRQPAVAGQFYPGDPAQLRDMVHSFLPAGGGSAHALVAVSPHAGYVYSGAAAGEVLGKVAVPRKVVVLGPNHRGVGAPLAVMSKGTWRTPLGIVELDEDLGGAFIDQCDLAAEDSLAHKFEHSLEVQVPFLQVIRDDLLLTPICVGGLSYEDCARAGRDLAAAIREAGEDVLMVASTDMTHYESAKAARTKDELAINQMLELDPQGLYGVVRQHGISMCGVLPTTIALVAAKELGAQKCELVTYTNSGEVSGDYNQVVGYAGLVVN